MPRHPACQKVITLPEEQFMQLKQGDVLLIRTPKGKTYIRTILEGPADSPLPWCRSVTFPKLCRSWTKRAYTTYLWNDLKDRATKVPGQNAHLINTFEHERLLRQGLNPRKELVREMREKQKDLAERAEFEQRQYGWANRFRPCQFKIKRISKVS